MAEPDPIDEPPAPVAQPSDAAGAADEAVAGDETESVEPDEETRLAELFGELWPLGPELKLDPTVDRARFRRQRDALKELGYRFQPVGQTWARSAAPAEA